MFLRLIAKLGGMTMRICGLASLVAALLAPSVAWASDPPPPSTANQCGRLAKTILPAIAYTHRGPIYPLEAQQRHHHGHVFLRATVDKYGFARQPVVVISSGDGALDQAAIDGVKDRWRWQPPPPECWDNGVVLGLAFGFGLDEPSTHKVFLNSPLYPAVARERKKGGTGKVEYTRSTDNKITDPHVISSTGSPDLDAAMLAVMNDTRLISDGTTSETSKASELIEFVPSNDPDSMAALMGPAITPDLDDLPARQAFFQFPSSSSPLPAPSLANGCGRNAQVILKQSPANGFASLPTLAAATGKQGRTWADVLVDKSGTASEVAIRETSGSQILDDATVQAIKGLWHYEIPPAECAEQGVQMPVRFDWFLDTPRTRVMPGDPGYPEDAAAGKLSGTGTALVKRWANGDIQTTKVVKSTGSPVLDAAMIKIMTMGQFTPGTKRYYQPTSNQVTFDFVGDPDAMRAAAAAPVLAQRTPSRLPPPSTANDCGRSAATDLQPVQTSHVAIPIPIITVKVGLQNLNIRAQGAVHMQVLVDKDGNAASVTVAESSAPPAMERAVTAIVKENYRWDRPPAECADRGVMMTLNYVYTWARPELQIYAGDADYPAAVRQRTMGISGIVNVRFRRDEIDDVKVLAGTNSPDLDAEIVKVASDRLLAILKASPLSVPTSQIYAVMFMPAFVASPKQQAAVK